MFDPKRKPDDGFYAALGIAITNWQRVEAEMCRLLAAALGANSTDQVGEVFFAIINFRDKLAAVDGGVRYVVAETDGWVKWDKIRTGLDKASKRRNKLAHGTVWVWDMGKGKYQEHLGPPSDQLSKLASLMDAGPNAMLSKHGLQQIAHSFTLHAQRVQDFRECMETRRGPRKGSSG